MDELIKDKHLVDVVIPAFNAEKYIAQTLESAVLQGDLVKSIIVVNDGSSDKTGEIVDNFSKTHQDITITLIDQSNQGLANARNTGIKAASAPYIALLDADDIWLDSKLQKQLLLFNKLHNLGLGAVYCGYTLINENSLPIAGKHLIIQPALRGDVYSKLLTGNFISGSGSSILIKANVFKDVGYFDETLKASEDWDMWLRIAKKYQFDYVDESLVQIRVHASNMQKDFSRMLASELAMLNKFEQNGTHNYFLLWKIQTILFKKKMAAHSIAGFDSSEPWVKSQFTGPIRLLWQSVLFVPNLVWGPLKMIKDFISTPSKGNKSK